MIKKILMGSLMVVMLASCSSKKAQKSNGNHNVLTAKEKKEGWELLYDGKNTNSWHKYGGGNEVGKGWQSVNGEFHLNAAAKAGGDIVTNDEFDDFHLKLEWKISEAGNSGVIIYVHEDAKKYRWPWQTGPEMQILDNDRHPDAKIHTHRSGDLYDMIASTPETVKQPMEWNQIEIISQKGKLQFFQNGVKVVETTMWDESWKNLIAKSKFKNTEGFGTYKRGRIGLQDHGDNVWFRNIKIKRLK